MKKIVTILSAALLLLAGTSAYAQMSVGAGYVNSVDSYKISKNADPSKNALNGFYAGFSYTMPLTGGLNFTPGAYYEFLTKNDASNVGGLGLNGNVTEHYLNVPLAFSYGASPAAGVRVFVFAGPTASVCLASTTDASASVAGVQIGGKTDNYDNNGYGRFDILLGGGAGIEFNGFRLTVGYDYGMLNRYTGGVEDVSRHTSRLHTGIAFLF